MAEAWVTLATNDAYALGCLVLGRSLRRLHTTRKLHCMVTYGVTQSMREHLSSVFDAISLVDVMDSKDAVNLALIKRPDLGVTFTKLNCWRLTQYTKCVFLDADTMVVAGSDDLFDRDELSAAPDIGWPDCFNSGVFVFRPSLETYNALVHTATTIGSFDGGDQGLLNAHFSNWRESDASHRLPFVYNMSSSVMYSYAAAIKRYASDVRIVHFLGAIKPWHHTCSADGHLNFRTDSHHGLPHVQQWWTIFNEDLRSKLDDVSHFMNIAKVISVSTINHRSSCQHVPQTSYPSCTYLPTSSTTYLQSLPISNTASFLPDTRVPSSYLGDIRSHTHNIPSTRQITIDVDNGSPSSGRPSTKHTSTQPEQPLIRQPTLSAKMNACERGSDRQASPPTACASQPTATVRSYGVHNTHTCPQCAQWHGGNDDRCTNMLFPIKVPIEFRYRHDNHVLQDTTSTDTLLANLTVSGGSSGAHQQPVTVAGAASSSVDTQHQRDWEEGRIDYTGKDSWENIQKQLDQSLHK